MSVSVDTSTSSVKNGRSAKLTKRIEELTR
jgi:hypothetical protein